MPTYLYRIAKFWDGSSEGWQYGSALHRLLPNVSWQELCLGSSANGLIVWQIHQDSCLAFCKTRIPLAPPKLHGRVRIGLPELHGRICMVWPKLYGQFHMVWPKLHRRFRIVWPKLGILYWDSICSHQICTVGFFWDTLSIMQEKHWKKPIGDRMLNLYQPEKYPYCDISIRQTSIHIVTSLSVRQLFWWWHLYQPDIYPYCDISISQTSIYIVTSLSAWIFILFCMWWIISVWGVRVYPRSNIWRESLDILSKYWYILRAGSLQIFTHWKNRSLV